ncbi:MAG: hypothetical protein ACK47B_11910 [Armatimonadota bacterium]
MLEMTWPRSSIAFLLLAGGISAASAAPAVAPKPAAAPNPAAAPALRAPEVTVDGYRFVIERITQQENLALDLEPAGAPVQGQQFVFLELAVYPPDPKQAVNVEGLDARLVAFANGSRAVALQPQGAEENDARSTGVWRTRLMASGLDLSVGRLSRLQGELVVYPQSQLLTLDFPLAEKLPLTRRAESFRATLKRVQPRNEAITAVVEMAWDSGSSIARANPEAPFGITAVTKGGAVLLPNGGGSSSPVVRGPITTREYTVTFTDLAETPASVRVQLLLRYGTPKRLAFTLPEIHLPDTLPLAEHLAGEETEAPPLWPGHPLYAERGGTLKVLGKAAAEEQKPLRLGFSRKSAAAFGPWRWLLVPVGADGTATLRHLLPGRYRVARAGAPEGEAPVEIEITAGGTASLPGAGGLGQ